jgi:hypothetical protein
MEERQLWEQRVREAALISDETSLRRLFNEGQQLFGAEIGHEWARVLSALDAGAVTG